MRIYFGVYIFPFVIFPPLWWFLFNFDTAVAENNQYIIRQYRYGGRDYYEQKSIYKKSGILEKYVGLFDSSDSYSELNQLDYEIKEFKIDNMTLSIDSQVTYVPFNCNNRIIKAIFVPYAQVGKDNKYLTTKDSI